MRKIQAIVIAAAFICGPVKAQDDQPGRYRLERTETGLVRLDTQTGAVSLCRMENADLICRMAGDERSAYQEKLDRLELRISALERRIGAPRPPGVETLPSDAEIDRSIGIMERFMRSFMGLVDEFRDDSTPPGPLPDRT